MKRLLVDTNVALDVLLDRGPHAEASVAIWAAVEMGRCEGFLAAHAITTIHYLVQKELGAAKAKQLVSLLLVVFRVAAVDGSLIEQALRLPMADFEDAVTVAAALGSGCEFIVTRDPKGFRGSPVRAMGPTAALPILGAGSGGGGCGGSYHVALRRSGDSIA
jgi:predicted nucleic acid-binding protein